MHIAFFSDQHPATLGGLQVSLGLQRKYLERRGHAVTVCAPTSSRAPLGQCARHDDILLSAVQVGEHSIGLAGRRSDRLVDAGFAAKPPVDLVHVQADVWGAWNGYRFARRHDLPVVHTMHTNVEAGLPNIMPVPGAASRLLFAAQEHFLGAARVRSFADYSRAFADRADLLIAPSSHFADTLRRRGVEEVIHVLPTGVDDDQLAAVFEAPRMLRARPVLVWPGRISGEKRLGEFLEAFARSGVEADVHVYGGGGELGRCWSRARALGLSARVTFFGPVSHDAVLRAMRSADAVVQSSIGYETQGLTVYEAASLGTPVILRDRHVAAQLPSGLRHLAHDGTIDAFAAAIRGFVSHSSEHGAGATPTDRFTQSRLTAAAEGLYAQVCGAAVPSPADGGLAGT